jgi:ancient ubiquitous protein 1
LKNKKPPIDSPSVADLCTTRTWSGSALLRWLYLPIGCVLAFNRLQAVIVMSLLAWPLPQAAKRVVYRSLLFMMGVKITCKMSPQEVARHTDGCIVALNHISVFDHFPVLAMPSATIIVANSDSPIGAATAYLLFKCSGGSFWKVTDKKMLARRLRDFRRNPGGTALYTTPEATINNGKGLFRFRPELLNRGLPVVPLAMRLRLPFGLTANPLHSSGVMKFFRLLMMPRLEFEMSYLAPQIREEHQSDQDFADQLQASIASHLSIPACLWTREDKYDYRTSENRRAA